MKHDYDAFWESSWNEEDPVELYGYLEGYYQLKSREIEIFKEHDIAKVCDAACGFGAYSLAFASNGFSVHSFDISETAVKLTINALEKYGIDPSNVKVASILATGYADSSFDGVIAHAVLDHLTLEDAKKALAELFRITRSGGLIWLSFDIPEEEDLNEVHVTLDDGTLLYTGEGRNGMLFRPYNPERIDELLKDYTIIHRAKKGEREYAVILEK
ncbi:class I SAM-dependent methyltransferase [Butyrivibrio sp. FCS014]|uniref:class I SAM-dependent methyltransferase n=1 Tax=Butyrivibrio sp. FCS014 TaxID=1408304 RepID=UPI000466DB25|nr:class I SAM-dependent methyltransferase [Butyrivibrio sp. FCS014]